MERYQNPAIQKTTIGTLGFVESLLVTAQEFCCTIDLSEPARPEEIYTGLHVILKCASDALAFEMEKVKKGQEGAE
ncbi:MAG: hypothetical protein KTR20_15120 [Cellvibrionaceae bacterium]|nr:hypothetical protein [Cellvibrionaceae bacterium]